MIPKCIKNKQEHRQLENRCTELENHEVYSTEEQRIGTWIDGKPLYRKVISHNITSTKQETELHNIDNLDHLINVSVSLNNQYGYKTSSTNDLNVSADDVNLYITSEWPLGMAYISLEYTKTTD